MSNYIDKWVEIDLDTIAFNTRKIKEIIGNQTKLMAVVKANAYGHGIYEVSKTVLKNGAEYLGVSTLEEGIKLREKGIEAPILIFSSLLPEFVKGVIDYNLIPTVCNLDFVQALDKAAKSQNNKYRVHFKIDTGFGRFGVLPAQAIDFVKIIQHNFDNLYIEGVYSHLATANSKDTRYSKKQFNIFKDTVEKIERETGKIIPIKHIANSSATIRFPEMRMNMVRVGNLIYGQSPYKFDNSLKLKEALKLKTKIVSIKKLDKGKNVGYNREFTTNRESTIAVIPVGYADGFAIEFETNSINFKNLIKNTLKNFLKFLGLKVYKKYVLINTKKAYVIGKISMQHSMIDITDLSDVSIGDEVTVSARKIAISEMIPRIYFEREKQYNINKVNYDVKLKSS